MTSLASDRQDFCFYEKQARLKGYSFIAGVDEAGRGPLAGPVVAAACIIPEGVLIEGVDDSKKLTPAQRGKIFDILISRSDICYGVGVVDADIIDQINILQATFKAMILAVMALSFKPDYVLVDGNKLPSWTFPSKPIIKGDSLSQSIAAASILAKETRDELMMSYDKQWPEYRFAKHKGYPTQVHVQALQRHGPCPIHRRTFEPVRAFCSSR